MLTDLTIPLPPPSQAAFASDILYIFTLWLTKCSVALLFIRLTPEQKHIFASYVVLGGSTLLMIVSEILVALRCDISHPWIFVDNGCGDLVSCHPHGRLIILHIALFHFPGQKLTQTHSVPTMAGSHGL